MKFYKRFMGDIQAKTGHLSLAEFGAYDRLLDHCYSTEEPLPADLDSCCRIARATSPAERKAVSRVLGEFFDLTDQGYVQHRVLEMLAEAQPKIAANQRNGKLGGRPKKKPDQTEEKPTGFSKETQGEPIDNLCQSQNQSIGTPTGVAKDQNQGTHTARVPETAGPNADGDYLGPPAAAAQSTGHARPQGAAVTFALKRAGLDRTNPDHPKLLTLLEAGATVAEFLSAWEDVRGKATSNPFTYLLGVVEGRRKEAAAMAGQIHQGPMPAKPQAVQESFAERDLRTKVENMAAYAPNAVRQLPGQPIERNSNIIDMEPPNAIAH